MYLKVLIKALESRDKMKKEHRELLDSFWGTDLFAELRQDNCVGYEFTYKTDDVNKLVDITIDMYIEEEFTIKDLINELKQHKDIQDYIINSIQFNTHLQMIEK